MLFKSGTITQASGSLGGLTAAHNRGGLYLRGRGLVTDPNSPAQQAVRALMGQLTDRWVTVLTVAQRLLWDTYAQNVPITGPLGDPRNVGGIGMFVRSNLPRLRAGLAVVDNGPTVFDLGEPVTGLTIGAIAGAGVGNGLNVQWTNTPAGTPALIVQQGRPINASANFFRGPWRFAGVEDPGATPFLIANTALPWPINVGERHHARVRLTYPDGRLSPVTEATAVAT